MVHNLSRPDVSHQVLENVLKQHFSPEELNHLHQHIEVLELPPRKEFWRSENTAAGIYIIIAGRVRLTDSHKNSLGLLEAGESFGELTLFPAASFSNYSVRTAKEAATLGFVSGQLIEKLSHKYPQILEHIHHRAVLRESQTTGLKVSPHNTLEKPVYLDKKLTVLQTPQLSGEQQKRQKIASAYFPSPRLKAGHWWQKIPQRYPFFAQHSAADCGAACLLMIASYWGKRFSINHLREMANVDRNGASLKGLSAAAESVGFSTRPVKASLNELAKQPLPAIAHWD